MLFKNIDAEILNKTLPNTIQEPFTQVKLWLHWTWWITELAPIFHHSCGEVGVPMARILTELKPPEDVTGLLLGYHFHTFRQ